jgi:DNA-binding transcriptional regulator YiaG
MSTFNKSFQDEIFRLARKEFRKQIDSYSGTLLKQKKEISELRKRIAQLESGAKKPKKAPKVVLSNRSRITSKGVKTMRTKYDISQRELGDLVGVAQITVHNWEAGKSKPRASQLLKLKEVQSLGKREVKKRLAGEAGS